jgi:hypothetical protein
LSEMPFSSRTIWGFGVESFLDAKPHTQTRVTCISRY